MDAKLKAAVNAACDWAAAATNQAQALSSQCVKLLNQASAEIAHVNLYNIYGDWCGIAFPFAFPLPVPLRMPALSNSASPPA